MVKYFWDEYFTGWMMRYLFGYETELILSTPRHWTIFVNFTSRCCVTATDVTTGINVPVTSKYFTQYWIVRFLCNPRFSTCMEAAHVPFYYLDHSILRRWHIRDTATHVKGDRLNVGIDFFIFGFAKFMARVSLMDLAWFFLSSNEIGLNYETNCYFCLVYKKVCFYGILWKPDKPDFTHTLQQLMSIANIAKNWWVWAKLWKKNDQNTLRNTIVIFLQDNDR